MNYATTKSEVIADIIIATMATVSLLTCWDTEGSWLFQAGLVWGGMNVGYLVTVYLNGEDND